MAGPECLKQQLELNELWPLARMGSILIFAPNPRAMCPPSPKTSPVCPESPSDSPSKSSSGLVILVEVDD